MAEITTEARSFQKVRDLPLRGGFLDALARRVLVYDGGMGATLIDRNLPAAMYGGAAYLGCHDYLVLSSPDVIEEIHTSYMQAGCDVLETNSFQASRRRLAE